MFNFFFFIILQPYGKYNVEKENGLMNYLLDEKRPVL